MKTFPGNPHSSKAIDHFHPSRKFCYTVQQSSSLLIASSSDISVAKNKNVCFERMKVRGYAMYSFEWMFLSAQCCQICPECKVLPMRYTPPYF